MTPRQELHRTLQFAKYGKLFTGNKTITVPDTATVTNPLLPPVAFPTNTTSIDVLSAETMSRLKSKELEFKGTTPSFIYSGTDPAVLLLALFFRASTTGSTFSMSLLRRASDNPTALYPTADAYFTLSESIISTTELVVANPGDIFDFVFYKGAGQVGNTVITLTSVNLSITRFLDNVHS